MGQPETVIGLEVHAQMNTKSKMFCGCDNDAFGKAPNTLVCPICMGHPGTLPVPNEEAISKALRAAAALKCGIAAGCRLDRKNYFYPDLPMGFQISQYDLPLARGGWVAFGDGDGDGDGDRVRGAGGGGRCRLTRLHIENDAGKLVHRSTPLTAGRSTQVYPERAAKRRDEGLTASAGRSYCDFNRAGTPLMEIVTEPDLRSPAGAVAFAKELQRILRTVDASEADMEKGMMRFDASISVRSTGGKTLHARSEIKNLNSFKALEKALSFEERRLKELWERGTPQESEVTVHWDDERGVGVILRGKESAADYRYFPEPDIPPLCFSEAAVAEARKSVGSLPEERRRKYREAGLDAAQVEMLVSDPRLAELFDEVVEGLEERPQEARRGAPLGRPVEGTAFTDVPSASASTGRPSGAPLQTKRVASIVLTQLLGFLNAAGKTLEEGPSADAVIGLLRLVDLGTIGANAAKAILKAMVTTGKGAEEIIAGRGLKRVDDAEELEGLVREALRENPRAVADIRAGKEKAKGAIIGSVMGKTRGQADPKVIRAILGRLV